MRSPQWLGMTMATLLLSSPASSAVVEVKGRDSKAVTMAIEVANVGDTVQLPEGTFELQETVHPKSGVRLVGAGQDKTRLVYSGTKPSALIRLNRCNDVEIAHLTLDGQSNPLVHQGITGGNSQRLWLHHLTIRNLKAETWGPHAILFSGRNPTMEGGVTDSRITDCRIENIGLDAKFGGGIRLAWGSVRNQVVGNTIHNTGRGGIFGDHSAELIIRSNHVSRSGGTGLGIEIWGGCPRSLIEDNFVDHWLSVDSSDRTAVRRNVIGTNDGTLKGYGIEIIARDVVVTDNVVNRGAAIGLSVSSKPVKNNVFWGYNTIRDCVQWGAQLQGDTGGIAHHYFHRCVFENTVRGDSRARYPKDSGHGFRTNGACRGMVFDDCMFRDNGGYGMQLGGRDVDSITFLRCAIIGNGLAAVTGPAQYTALEFKDCKVEGNKRDQLPAAKPFSGLPPVADFRLPSSIRAGEPAQFQCSSRVARGKIVERLWDLGEGIPEVTAQPKHTFGQPGKYRVTLVVWDGDGRGAWVEKTVHVGAALDSGRPGEVKECSAPDHPKPPRFALRYDPARLFEIALPAGTPPGEASIREHAIAWHPVKRKFYLVADVVPLASSHHPNTYNTELYLWSSPDLTRWTFHGVAVPRGQAGETYDRYGVASPAGMAFFRGKLYVPFSARRTPQFTRRSIGLARSGDDPERLPWIKTLGPISDLDGEDDDPAVVVLDRDDRLHLYHRTTAGGYRIVHTASANPDQPGSWPIARPVTERAADVRAQELTGAAYMDGRVHLFVIEHLQQGGIKIGHFVSPAPDGIFPYGDPASRFVEGQPTGLAYGGHLTPIAVDGKLIGLSWTVAQVGRRYGLEGHLATLVVSPPR